MRCSLAIKPRTGQLFIAALALASLIATVAPIRATAYSSPPENGQVQLSFIGDSLTVGTMAFGQLQTKIDNLGIWLESTVNAKVGRRAGQSIPLVKQAIEGPTSALVIALGTNDMISRRETWYPRWIIDKIMSETNGVPVLWFNVDFSPTGRGDWRFRARRFNRALRDAQEQWPNLHIADWYNYFTPRGKSRFISDGVHLTVSGYKTRSSFTIRELQKFATEIINATTTTSAPSTTTQAPTSSTSPSTDQTSSTTTSLTTVPTTSTP